MYKKFYFIHIENGSQAQALYHGLVLKKVHSVINFKQKPCLKPYIDMNTELRENAKKRFFWKLVNNSVLGKTMENVKNYRDIKLATTKEEEIISFQKPKRKTFSGKL